MKTLMAQQKRYVIDSTPDSAVVRCTRCDWRGYSHAKPSAYRQVADHLKWVHDDWKAASDARKLAMNANRRLSTAVGADQESQS